VRGSAHLKSFTIPARISVPENLHQIHAGTLPCQQVASCKLHGIDPEDYLRDVIRVMPYWPRDRYLELSPLKWTATRACLDADQLAREYGRIAIPAPSAAEDETASG
jgi:hypothetical protein